MYKVAKELTFRGHQQLANSYVGKLSDKPVLQRGDEKIINSLEKHNPSTAPYSVKIPNGIAHESA